MLASENFVLDFEVNFDSIPSGGRQDALLFSSASAQQYGANPSSHSWYIILKQSDNSPGQQTSLRTSAGETNSSEVANPTADTWYWYRFIRNGTTTTCTRHTTEANRTSGTADVTMTTSSLPSGWDDTDVIKHFNFGGYSSGGADFDVRNIFLYRGVTSV